MLGYLDNVLDLNEDQITDENDIAFRFVFHLPKYDHFYNKFLISNAPCILACGILDKWKALKDWVDAKGEPDLHDIYQKYGDLEVPVANCSEKYFDSQPKTQQLLKNYIDYMRQEQRQESLYLKDWHLERERRRRPALPPFYRTPALFASDWLNEFWEANPEREDDYRFVYVGVSGTWTPFHADVFRSFSWSANVSGRKRWILLPPGEERKLQSLSGLPYDVAAVLGAESAAAAVGSAAVRPDASGTARLDPMTSPGGVRYYDVTQEAGEVMLVPSGWHHQVWNLADTVSVNHNWLNAANAARVTDHMLASLAAARAELADIADGSEEWLAQCQRLLRATHGMDLRELAELLCWTAGRRLDGLRRDAPVEALDGWRYGRRHLVSDLRRLRAEAARLLAVEEFGRMEALSDCREQLERVVRDVDALDLAAQGETRGESGLQSEADRDAAN